MKKILSFIFVIASTLSLLSAGGKSDKLFPVVEDGSKEQIKEILSKEPDLINASRGTEHQTILMSAAASDRNNEIITMLLKYGAKSKSKTSEGKTALMYAVQFNTHPDVIHTLIEDNSFLNSTKKAKILDADKYGRNAFDYAQENPNKENILQILYKYVPADEVVLKDNEDDTENTQIARATENIPEEQKSEKQTVEETPVETYSFEIKEAIPEPAQIPPPSPVTAVAVAPVPNIEDSIILESKPEPKIEEIKQQEPEKQEETVIPEPAKTTQETVSVQQTAPVTTERVNPYKTEYLFDYIEMGDDNEVPPEDPNFNSKYAYIENADKKDLNGRTALMRSAKSGNIQQIENLIFSGANVNERDNDGWTPLMYASRFCNDEKIASLLIKKGARTEARNNYGISALSLAAGFNKNPAVVKVLLDKRSVNENEVKVAFLYAITNNAPVSTVDLFIQKGLKINIAYDGKTPLMHACKTNKTTAIIDYLLNSGAKTTYKSSEGKNAFQYAKENPRLPHDEVYWKLNALNGEE